MIDLTFYSFSDKKQPDLMSPAVLLAFLALTVLFESEAMKTSKSLDPPTYKFKL